MHANDDSPHVIIIANKNREALSNVLHEMCLCKIHLIGNSPHENEKERALLHKEHT